eukprot:RCo046301
MGVPWANPVRAGLVTVQASFLKRGSLDGAEVGDFAFHDQVYYTDNRQPSWVTIDFLGRLIIPSHYRMAHRARLPNFFSRSWTFSGSRDGTTWKVLREHFRDETLGPRTMVGAWVLPPDPDGEGFSMFRVSLLPRGNSAGTNALVLSCFEIYGVLMEPAAV